MDGVRTGYLTLLLNTNRSTYAQVERAFLAGIAETLRAVVRPAIDADTQAPFIMDLNGGIQIQV